MAKWLDRLRGNDLTAAPSTSMPVPTRCYKPLPAQVVGLRSVSGETPQGSKTLQRSFLNPDTKSPIARLVLIHSHDAEDDADRTYLYLITRENVRKRHNIWQAINDCCAQYKLGPIKWDAHHTQRWAYEEGIKEFKELTGIFDPDEVTFHTGLRPEEASAPCLFMHWTLNGSTLGTGKPIDDLSGRFPQILRMLRDSPLISDDAKIRAEFVDHVCRGIAEELNFDSAKLLTSTSDLIESEGTRAAIEHKRRY